MTARSSRAGLAAPALTFNPAEALAQGFAQQVQAWAQRMGSTPASQRAASQAAHALSLATSNSQVCLPLEELVAERASDGAPSPGLSSRAWRDLLLASHVVALAHDGGAGPMLLDAQDRLYLRRYFDYEQRLARRLHRALHQAPVAIGPAAQTQLRCLFAAPADSAAAAGLNGQQVAAALALRQHLCVISGGPGTGKTTTVVKLLVALLADQPGARIALAAPTGKAAARMLQALQQHASSLPAALRVGLPSHSFTLHRLLGSQPGGGFKHHAGQPLPIDVLVVDEASMLDLALTTQLLEAVPDGARIILLGDKDQLAAVEAGAVFAELCANPALSAACRSDIEQACALPAGTLPVPPAGAAAALADSSLWLTQNYRFAADSGIGRLAGHIHAGQAAATLAQLRAASSPAVRWLEDLAPQPGAATLGHLQHGYAPYLQCVQDHPDDPARVHAAFAAFRALCAVQNGPWGVRSINQHISRWAQARGPNQAASEAAADWYVGRAVMVLRNDPQLRLFNGDIGIVLPAPVQARADAAAPALMVYFADADGGWRGLSPLRLPEHQTAFAMTVHKAQGSEFDEVMLLLPTRPSPVLSRELLYTAVTRARQRVTLAGRAAVVSAAVLAPTRRHSGLLDRLQEEAAAQVATKTARDGRGTAHHAADA